MSSGAPHRKTSCTWAILSCPLPRHKWASLYLRRQRSALKRLQMACQSKNFVSDARHADERGDCAALPLGKRREYHPLTTASFCPCPLPRLSQALHDRIGTSRAQKGPSSSLPDLYKPAEHARGGLKSAMMAHDTTRWKTLCWNAG